MYVMWMSQAGYWLPRVDESYSKGFLKGFLYREMNVYLKQALACFMEEECV